MKVHVLFYIMILVLKVSTAHQLSDISGTDVEIDSSSRISVALKPRMVDKSGRMVVTVLWFDGIVMNRNACFRIKCSNR
jgi:hypothetical protein